MMIQTFTVLSIAALLSSATPATCAPAADVNVVHVSGSGVDGLNSAIIHSKVTSATGLVQKSTEIIDLHGDLEGRVLYHVTTVIDFVKGTLVNTGDEVYSGTISGSDPVMIHDDQFRFDVNLNTGEESGDVYLVDPIAGPKVRCTLHVVGTGATPEGNPTFTYTGDCRFQNRSGAGVQQRLP